MTPAGGDGPAPLYMDFYAPCPLGTAWPCPLPPRPFEMAQDGPSTIGMPRAGFYFEFHKKYNHVLETVPAPW